MAASRMDDALEGYNLLFIALYDAHAAYWAERRGDSELVDWRRMVVEAGHRGVDVSGL